MSLERLDEHDIREIIAGVAAGRALPAPVVAQIVANSDGVPLFAEELTKTALDSGQFSDGESPIASRTKLAYVTIPTALLDSLMARLDRLPQEKSVAQLAAVIGRSFSFELLAAVAEFPREKLIDALHRLEEAELIYERRPAANETFEFKHALIQEAAYQSQLRSVRRAHHRKIADALEQRFPSVASTQPEMIARHYAEAECPERALKHWQAAGMRAIEQSANVEAVRHLDQALRLVPRIENPEERRQTELAVQLARGMALTAVEGYASPAVEYAYMRALSLCGEGGTERQKFAALFGLWRIVITQPELNKAKMLAFQLLENAERLGAVETVLTAHGTIGITSLFRGELLLAEDSFRQVGALYDPVVHRALAISAGQDPGLACMMYSALAWCLRGNTERALTQYAEALDRARAGGHAFTLAYTLHLAAIIEQCINNLPKLSERAAELKHLTAERNFAQLRANARVFLGYVACAQGGGSDALREMEQSISEVQKASGLNLPYFMAMFADACGKSGHIEQGLAKVNEAISLADKTGVQWCKSELCRVKAELLAQRDKRTEGDIDSLFVEAIAIAKRQGATSLERKASDELNRWRQRLRRA